MNFELEEIRTVDPYVKMPTSPTSPMATIPSTLEVSRPRSPDSHGPRDVVDISHDEEVIREQHDYTENAPQAVVNAIAIEREREQNETPPDLMVGSLGSWAGGDDSD
jgi:cation-transporting ATPase 13A2